MTKELLTLQAVAVFFFFMLGKHCYYRPSCVKMFYHEQ